MNLLRSSAGALATPRRPDRAATSRYCESHAVVPAGGRRAVAGDGEAAVHPSSGHCRRPTAPRELPTSDRSSHEQARGSGQVRRSGKNLDHLPTFSSFVSICLRNMVFVQSRLTISGKRRCSRSRASSPPVKQPVAFWPLASTCNAFGF